MMLSPIYCIPGMGVDGKIYGKLKVEGRRLHHLSWLEPKRGESIQDYARRMVAQIPEKGPVDLMGLSFGGMMAVEMSHIIPVRRIILLSSIKTSREKPWPFRVMRIVPLYLTNVAFLRDRTTWLWCRFFGLYSKEDIATFYEFMPGLSDYYMRWALRQICHWRKGEALAEVFHIHGDRDLIFPVRRSKAHVVVKGGTHSMVFTHANQVSRLIGERLAASIV